MKHILITLIFLLALPAEAKKPDASHLIEIQRAALNDLYDEGNLLKVEFDREISKLNFKDSILRSRFKNQNKTASGPIGTASISGLAQVAGINQADVVLYLYDVTTREFAGSALTGALGEFNFPDLVAGDYYLLANDSADAYVDAMWSSLGTEQCYNCQPSAENYITVADAENRNGLVMELVVGASLSGNVTSSGLALEDVRVFIRPVNNQGYYGNALTDLAGDYTIQGLPAGDYYLVTGDQLDIYIDAQWTPGGTIECNNCEPDPANNIGIMLGDDLVGFDFELTVGATLTGNIADSTSMVGIETMEVNLFDPSGLNNGYFNTQFDGSGNYTIQGIPQGTYKVYLSPNRVDVNDYIPEVYNNIQCNQCNTILNNGAGDDVILTNGMTTSGIDFELEIGASISGEILNAADLSVTVEEFGYVFVFDATNRLVTVQLLFGTNYEPTFDGRFKIGGLLPGSYFVQGGDAGREFYQRELFNNIRCPWSGCDRGGGGDAVVLGAGEQRVGIDFHLEYGGKISGTVTDALTGMPIDYELAQYVQFYDAMGNVAGGAGILPDGTYTSQRAIAAGTYSVRTGSMFGGNLIAPYVMQKYDSSGNIDCPGVTCDLTLGNVVVAELATTTNIDFALSTAFSFSGTITELDSANPIPDVHVLVYDDNANFATWATTDAMGDFTASGLPAGTYYALTNNGSNLPFMGYFPVDVGDWIDILFDGTPCPGSACDVTTGTPIELGVIRGTSPILDFGLSTGGTITGKVNVFGSQLPASFVNINVYNDQGELFGSYPSDSNGMYVTVGLPNGTYYLVTSNNGALVNVKFGDEQCNNTCIPLDAMPLTISNEESLVNIDFTLKTDYVFKSGIE